MAALRKAVGVVVEMAAVAVDANGYVGDSLVVAVAVVVVAGVEADVLARGRPEAREEERMMRK